MTEMLANLAYELKRMGEDLKSRIKQLAAPMQIAERQSRIHHIEMLMSEENFWTHQSHAALIQKEKADLEKVTRRYLTLETGILDASELVDMLKEDPKSLLEVEQEMLRLSNQLQSLEMEQMLGQPEDKCPAILSINVGQGGVEAQDFVDMLFRMYKRYAERKGFLVELVDSQPAEEAGFKNVVLRIEGEYAYGYLKSEVGVHRLVRISPFDANARRHTSFASVWVLPEIDDDIEVDIKSEDLKIDTYRAGGAGGQHVNKTESAIRITHLPTNTVVTCQAERSQQKNRSTAMKMLRSKLYDLELRKRMKEKDKAEAEKMEASFGSQIRNYVLAPYRLIKDLRTNYEIGNVDAVLDGDIQPFIDAYLLMAQNKKAQSTLK